MSKGKSSRRAALLACLCLLVCGGATRAQIESDAIHELDVRLTARRGQVGGVRVRLLRQSRMQPIAETFSGHDGQVRFTGLLPGDYIVETSENESFEATNTRVSVNPLDIKKPTPMRVDVTIELPARRPSVAAAPGVVSAETDTQVPEAARKHYQKGLELSRAGKSEEAAREYRAAVEAYPQFYAARLELGRELRAQKHFQEALDTFKPLVELAPRRAEPRIESGIVLLVLRRPRDATRELRRALELEEANWVAHLYLGWALFEDAPDEAARHFTRALELDERKAAQAHLSLARLAYSRGRRQDAISHLEAYLTLNPDAPDAPQVRGLLAQLRR